MDDDNDLEFEELVGTDLLDLIHDGDGSQQPEGRQPLQQPVQGNPKKTKRGCRGKRKKQRPAPVEQGGCVQQVFAPGPYSLPALAPRVGVHDPSVRWWQSLDWTSSLPARDWSISMPGFASPATTGRMEEANQYESVQYGFPAQVLGYAPGLYPGYWEPYYYPTLLYGSDGNYYYNDDGCCCYNGGGKFLLLASFVYR